VVDFFGEADGDAVPSVSLLTLERSNPDIRLHSTELTNIAGEMAAANVRFPPFADIR
jgi:hypothetical protein